MRFYRIRSSYTEKIRLIYCITSFIKFSLMSHFSVYSHFLISTFNQKLRKNKIHITTEKQCQIDFEFIESAATVKLLYDRNKSHLLRVDACDEQTPNLVLHRVWPMHFIWKAGKMPPILLLNQKSRNIKFGMQMIV